MWKLGQAYCSLIFVHKNKRKLVLTYDHVLTYYEDNVMLQGLSLASLSNLHFYLSKHFIYKFCRNVFSGLNLPWISSKKNAG